MTPYRTNAALAPRAASGWDWGGTIPPLLALVTAAPVVALAESSNQRTVAALVVAIAVGLLREPAAALAARLRATRAA